jgi:hypothetical protein
VSVPVPGFRPSGSEQAARPWPGHLRLLAAAGAIDAARAARLLTAFDDVRALTWRLLEPKV